MTKPSIGIVSCGIGNITSVGNALHRVGAAWALVETPSDVARFRKVILPGVGAFGPAMSRLREAGLDRALVEGVRGAGTHLLGICLGMQLLFETSTEHGVHAGLGLVPGTVELLGQDDPALRVPHIGWNSVVPAASSRLLAGCGPSPDFYFVHSYACHAADRATVGGTCEYGGAFDAVVESGPVFGCQFHPEKSQRPGLQVLKNFSEIPC